MVLDPELPLGDPPTVEPSNPNELADANLRAERLEAELAESRRQVASERQRLDSFIARVPDPVSPAAAHTRVDPNSVPDPSMDLDAFRAHQASLADSNQANMNRQIAELRDEQQASNLWNQFIQRYPAYAGLDALAKAAFQQVSARGLSGGNAAVIDAVKAEMDIMRGGPIEDAQKTPAKPNRTAGTSGASDSTLTIPNNDPPEKTYKPTTQIIAEKQQEWGLI